MLRPINVMIGGDPELFLNLGGKIIGSEKVIPPEGLKGGGRIKPSVVRDGVQVELNPQARNSTDLYGKEIEIAFELLSRRVGRHPGVTLDYTDLIEVSRAELDSLSPTSRILGCKPSKNVYGERPITVDPETYPKRSAGGHLHFGLTSSSKLFNERVNMIPLFDIFVGNTCVMLDRGKGAKERRENYGRAGEYREQPHGVEYRTLSNFWLRNYVLTSFVYGMARVAISVIAHRLSGAGDVEEELIKVININDVIQAIDTNDFELAEQNFHKIRPFLVKHLPGRGFPLNPSTILRFMVLAKGVKAKGIELFFPEDPAYHWTKGKKYEFEEFIEGIR